jgi:propionyl-CoA carboxylase alpha chain
MPVPAITRLLIANRGEIALRIIRTAREMDIATVAVFSDPDAGAPYVRAADEAIRLPGAAPRDTYLRGAAIIAAAAAAGADAVHPGYGFLAENAGFARDCAAAGLTFVGPPPAVIEAMGSKLAARDLLAAAGVPVLPGLPVLADPAGPGEAEKLAAAAAEVGYPVLVKAAFGGGGRGMRIVRAPGELAGAVESAAREAASAFGDGTVFIERYLEAPRHIEVQIVGDAHGTVAHLFERECSVQRRYQKIIEESPSPAVDERLRAELGATAVRAARAIGYVGAGTVEFVMDPAGSFWFLEVNTRLQVEHPVTELVTGLDLVRLQLEIAAGAPLPPEVTGARLSGHAIEARICAEDPRAGFRPAAGVLRRFAVPGLPGVRTDAGVADGSVVGVHYDSMLAKVIAHGPTRDAARRRLARALAEAQLHGVTTNRDLLVAVLREADFAAGRIDTGYLAGHPALLDAGLLDGLALDLHLAAAALAGQAERRAAARVLAAAPSGWRNVRSEDQHAEYLLDGERHRVQYRIDRDGLRASVDGRPLPGAELGTATADEVELTAGGVTRRFRVHRAGSEVYVDSPLGSVALTEAVRFPEPDATAVAGSLRAPLPGTVVRVAAEAGQRVAAGDPIVILEAMKMEHVVVAPGSGVVAEVAVRAGQAVEAGAELARVT